MTLRVSKGKLPPNAIEVDPLFVKPLKLMLDRLVKGGIDDKVVLTAIAQIPRHQFVDSGLSARAYEDVALPIGAKQTISKPSTVAKMLATLRQSCGTEKLKKVLEIGTGCGYQAAVLAKMSEEVYSIERIKSLHEKSRVNLRPLRLPNLRLHYGDGMLGLPEVAPFDAIIIAAAGLTIPEALLKQLSIGGYLIAPVGKEQQTLQLICRIAEKYWKKTTLDECFFVPLKEGTSK